MVADYFVDVGPREDHHTTARSEPGEPYQDMYQQPPGDAYENGAPRYGYDGYYDEYGEGEYEEEEEEEPELTQSYQQSQARMSNNQIQQAGSNSSRPPLPPGRGSGSLPKIQELVSTAKKEHQQYQQELKKLQQQQQQQQQQNREESQASVHYGSPHHSQTESRASMQTVSVISQTGILPQPTPLPSSTPKPLTGTQSVTTRQQIQAPPIVQKVQAPHPLPAQTPEAALHYQPPPPPPAPSSQYQQQPAPPSQHHQQPPAPPVQSQPPTTGYPQSTHKEAAPAIQGVPYQSHIVGGFGAAPPEQVAPEDMGYIDATQGNALNVLAWMDTLQRTTGLTGMINSTCIYGMSQTWNEHHYYINCSNHALCNTCA